MARTSDFQENGILRARTLNDELDYQVAALQEVKDVGRQRAPPRPLRSRRRHHPAAAPARANKLLGFDSAGAVTVFDRDGGALSLPFQGAVPRTVEDKLAERLSARDFGAVGDGAADDGPALQAAMNAAAASGKRLEIGEGTFRTTMPLTLPGAAAGLSMRGTILYAGPGGRAALTLGDGGAVRNAAKLYEGLRVIRAAVSDWTDESDIGIVAPQPRRLLRRAPAGGGLHHRPPHPGRRARLRGHDPHARPHRQQHDRPRHPHRDRRRLEHIRALLRRALRHRQQPAPGAEPLRRALLRRARRLYQPQQARLPRAGLRVAGAGPAGDRRHPLPLRGVQPRGDRQRACGWKAARRPSRVHTGGAQDHVYEVAWASQGYNIGIEYAPTATRVGSVVRALHQAAATAKRRARSPPCRTCARRPSASATPRSASTASPAFPAACPGRPRAWPTSPCPASTTTSSPAAACCSAPAAASPSSWTRAPARSSRWRWTPTARASWCSASTSA